MNQKDIREQTVRDAKANLILDAARKVFSDNGFHNTKLEDIAQVAGFSKASLYNYFSDKEEIFLSLAIRDFDELLTKLRLGMKPSEPVLTSIEYLLRTVFTFFGEQFAFLWETANYQMCQNFNAPHLVKQHQELVKTFHGHFVELVDTFTVMLGEARKRGEIKSTVNEATLSRFIASLARGVVFEWKMRGKMGDVEETVMNLLAFITSGLGHIVVTDNRAEIRSIA
ncbi:MAG: TetR/AcrR family transcriptional regulator [Fibrobacterota bacterium]